MEKFNNQNHKFGNDALKELTTNRRLNEFIMHEPKFKIILKQPYRVEKQNPELIEAIQEERTT
jgi:ApbE superfamily uncharacterized protein (UPF0280 family)